MPKISNMLLLALLVQVLAACGPSTPSGYQGYLYFANGSYLMQFSLRDAGLSVIHSFSNTTIEGISGYGENRLLLTESELVNRLTVHQIAWLDVKTGQGSTLYPGYFARYFADTGLMIYDDGQRLFVVNQAGDLSTKTIFTHKMNQVNAVMAIPDNTVLFETNEEGLQGIYSYHLLDGTLESLDRLSGICQLKFAVWIDDLDQIACKPQPDDGNEGAYVITSLAGEVSHHLTLPEGGKFDALAYIAEQNALVLKERWTGRFSDQEKYAVWIHNLQNGESRRLASNIDLGSSVVYTSF